MTDKLDKIKQFKKRITGADLIIALFLVVTIPHTSFVLSGFEYADWWLLAWSMAAAIDLGIAYGGLVSSSKTADKEAKFWATVLFIGLSLGSYFLNIAHYVAFGAEWFSIGLGLFFPGGILLLAKIKSRNEAISIAVYIEAKVKEAVRIVEAQWREIYDGAMATAEEQKQALLNQPDPLRLMAENELADTKAELAEVRRELAELKTQKALPVGVISLEEMRDWKAEAERLAATGMSKAEIARQLNVSRPTVSNYLNSVKES